VTLWPRKRNRAEPASQDVEEWARIALAGAAEAAERLESLERRVEALEGQRGEGSSRPPPGSMVVRSPTGWRGYGPPWAAVLLVLLVAIAIVAWRGPALVQSLPR
jgi:hypothetical protein